MAEITYEQLCDRFDEMFDDCTPEVNFGGLIYQPSDVLKSVDPIAYREEVICYIDSLLTDEQIYEHSNGTYHDEPEDDPQAESAQTVYIVTTLKGLEGSVHSTMIADLLARDGEAEITEDCFGQVIDVQRVTKD